MNLVVRRPYPSLDAWLREEAHLFSAERAWLVGVDAPPGTTASLTIGLKGDDPILEANVYVEGVAGDFNGQPLLAVRWLDLDASAIETLQSLLRVDFSAIASAQELALPPLSSAPEGVAQPVSEVLAGGAPAARSARSSAPVAEVEAEVISVRSEPPFAEPAPRGIPTVDAPRASSSDALDRLRARAVGTDATKAILARGRALRGRSAAAG